MEIFKQQQQEGGGRNGWMENKNNAVKINFAGVRGIKKANKHKSSE
jgi:hypothetical protein